MASTNKRDVRLGVEIETAGEENLKRLAAEVRALAKAGGDAAPQYIELADAIERNASVARELSAFKAAADAIEKTSAASEQATISARRLREEYDQQAAVTQTLQANQARVAAALEATRRQLLGATEQASVAKNALKGADDATGELARTATAAADRVAALKRDVGNLGLDLKTANEQSRAAAQGLRDLAEQSLRADDSARSQASALRAQVEAQERARAAAAQLGEEFTNVAAAQERLDAALQGGAGAIEAAAAAERLALQEREAQAAVDALTSDLDRQAEVVRGKLVPSLLAASDAYEREQAAIRESLALADREAADGAKKAALAQRLTQLREEEVASIRGETEERKRAQAVAESELAAIRESEQFLATYNDRKREAAAEALRFVEALEQEAAAADKASRRTAEFNAQADQTKKSDAYVRELAAAFDAVEKQAAEAAAQVQRLQGYFDRLAQQRDVVSGAFGTTGVRSIQAIEQEMFKLQRALVTLQGEFSGGRISVADFERATASARVRLAALKQEIETVPGDRGVFDQLATGANNLITKFGALGAALATVGFAIKPVIDAFIALESTTRILTQVTGSTAEAARQIEFLRKTAQQSGQSFTDVSQSYAKFAASALQAGLSNEQVQATFKSVALAAGNLGLSSDQAKRALEALGQIASKGTVSMEELRQQLGDALPGVLPLLAKQLGLTNSELNKLVEAGELSAGSAIPALAKALESLGPKTGVVDGLVASFNRFKNVMLEAGTNLLEGPLGKFSGAVLSVLAKGLESIAVLAVGVSETFNIMGRSLGAIAAYTTGSIKSLSDLGAELRKIKAEANDSLKTFADRTLGAAEAAGGLGKTAAATAPAVQALGTASTGAAQSQAALGTAVGGAGSAAAGSVAPMQAAATATAQVGVAAGQAFASLEQMKVAYVGAIASAKSAADAAKLAAEAKKTEVESLKEVAALTGNEVLIKRSAVEAAGQLAIAVGLQAEAEQRQLDLSRQFVEALKAKLTAQGTISEQDEKDLKRRDEELAKQTQAVQKTVEQAEALERQAQAARLSAETMKDNSDKQRQFARAAEDAAEAVERARIALADGSITAREYRDTVAASAIAQGRLRDAIEDTSRRMVSNAKQQYEDNQLRFATIKIRLEELRNVEAKAVADKNETLAAETKIKVKQAELEITKLNNQAKLEEAKATVEATQNLLREADAGRTELTPEKRAELEARLTNAQAKVKEAEAAVVSEKRDEAEIERLKRLRFAIEGTTTARKQAAAAQATLANPTAGEIDGGGTKTFFAAADAAAAQRAATRGGTPVDASYVFGLRDRLTKGDTFKPDEIPAILNALNLAKENQNLGRNAVVPDLQANRDDAAWVATLTRVLELAQSRAAIEAAGATSSGSNSLGIPSSAVPVQAPAAVGSSTRTVNINIAGLASAAVNVASDADAVKLEALLQSLAAAAGRAGP